MTVAIVYYMGLIYQMVDRYAHRLVLVATVPILCFTGTSKGYGFVEFAHNPEKSNDVRKQLDGKKIDSFVLECDFVLPEIISFDQLHSCCLLVDQLPADYKNLMDLRAIFSRLVMPPYCQVSQIYTSGRCGHVQRCITVQNIYK